MKALAAFAATKHIAVSIRHRAACLVAACPRLGANTFRFASRMRCGDAPFVVLKFYKNAARLNFKILKQDGQNCPSAKF